MARIVIVEDDSLVALGMRLYLESRGHEVAAIAATGSQALSSFLTSRLDLILMDVRLKGEMDGVEAARRIQTQSDLPIIFVSGSGDPDTLRRIRALNPADLLLKPVTPSDLAAAVDRVMAGRGEVVN